MASLHAGRATSVGIKNKMTCAFSLRRRCGWSRAIFRGRIRRRRGLSLYLLIHRFVVPLHVFETKQGKTVYAESIYLGGQRARIGGKAAANKAQRMDAWMQAMQIKIDPARLLPRYKKVYRRPKRLAIEKRLIHPADKRIAHQRIDLIRPVRRRLEIELDLRFVDKKNKRQIS